MTIHELLQAAGLTANDEIPIWDADGTGEPTKKITAQQLAAAVVTLANLVTSVNNQTGAVSITPANIGAVAKSGDTMTGTLYVNRTSDGGEADVEAKSAAGSIYLYSTGSNTGTRGIYSYNASNVPVAVIEVPQDNHTIFYGKATENVAKSGDTMTGPLKWGSAAALPAASSLQYFLGIDAFADGGTTHYITAANLLAAIGAVAATGSRNELTAGPNITNKNTNIRKWGKIGVLTLYFEVTAQINAYAHIFTATSGYKPEAEYNSCVSDLSGKSYPVYYNADGILQTRVAMPAGTYYGNLSFFFAQ